MRIGLFTDTYIPDINGVVSSIRTLQLELEKNGHDVYVITTYPGLFQIQKEGNVYRLPGIELKFLYGYVLTSPIHLKALEDVKAMNLDVIHAHTEFGVGIFARIVAKSLDIPLVSTYHTTYEDYTHYVNIFNSNRVDEIAKKAVAKLSKLYGDSSVEVIAPSLKTKEMLLRYHIRRDIYVIPTGLDLEKFDKSNTTDEQVLKIRQECKIENKQKMMLFVGRVAKEKSIDIVIEGFKYIKEKGLNVKFVIVGDGPEKEHLEKQARDLDLLDYVYFAGRKAPSEVPCYYHSADMFVSASLTETQGMTYIEALASGLAVFARPDDVLQDLVIEGNTGYLFESPEEFALKVEEYLALDEKIKQEMTSSCINHVKQYDSDEFYKSILHVYEKAIEHYSDLYTIKSIKHKQDNILVRLENISEEDIKLVISVDDFFEYGLRKDMKINNDVLQDLLKCQEKALGYQLCINKLMVKDRTCKEMYDILTQKTNLDIESINRIIEKLEEKGLIDDYKYARNQVDLLSMVLQGPNKIIRTLKKKGVPLNIIEQISQEMANPDEEYDHAYRWAIKAKNSIKDKSVMMKKKLLKQKMYAQGYNNDIINKVVENLNFGEDELNQIDIVRKVALKAYKRYSKKYSGTNLRNSIYRYCSSQGFEAEDIYLVLNEMEWDDE